MKKIRVLVVDNENVVREGFVTLLKLNGDMEVVGEAANGLQALSVARKTKPDVVLLDMHMPELDGLQTIPRLKKMLPDCKILVLTGFSQSDQAYQAIKAGAMGYLLKDSTRVQLVQAIRDVAAGQPSISPDIAMKVITDIENPVEPGDTSTQLTPRELETLRLIAQGLSNQEIANQLFVHTRTVAKHVSSILDKLQVPNRTQAAIFAIREGLTDSPNGQPSK